jgi:hypothetical protein
MTDQEPDYTNHEGFKWWLHGDLSKYAKSKGLDMMTWIVEEPRGSRYFVTLSKGKAVHSSQQVEAVATWMDVQAFVKDSE